MKARIIGIAIILAMTTMFTCGCGKGRILSALQPIATNGYLDLGDGKFPDKHMVRLDGEWKFYWKQLISPSVFENRRIPDPSSLIEFPGYWIDTTVHGEIPDMHGFATYYLEIRGLESGKDYGLVIPDMSYSYNLWVNGVLFSTNGVVGTNAATTVYDMIPRTVYFRAPGENIKIVLHLASFSGLSGGCKEPILFGTEPQVMHYRQRLFMLEVFMTSVLLIMFVYHLMLFLFIVKRSALTKKEEKRVPYILYFSIICLLMAINSGFTKQRFLLDIIPGIPWNIAVRIELISWVSLLYAFAAFLNEFFREMFSRRLSRLFEIASFALVLFVLVTPTRFTAYAEIPFELLGILFIAYTGYVLMKVAVRRETDPTSKRYVEAARIMVVGLGILILTGVNDFLYRDTYFIRYGILTYVGAIILMLMTSFAIVWRFPEIFKIIKPKRQKHGKGILMAMIEAGGGHKSPAMAAKEAMEELFPSKYDITVSDFTKDVGAIEIDEKHKKQWQFLLANPAVTMLGYYVQDSFGFVTRALLKDWIEPFINIGADWLRRNPPQVFVSFHFMNTIVAIEARKKYDLNFPIVTYLTEPMDAHSMWVWKETDIMIVSSRTAKNQLIQRGFPEEKIFIVPYPVRPSFFKINTSVAAAKKELGFDPNYKTIILSSGAEGLGRIESYAKALIKADLPINVIVICGKNEKMKADLDEVKKNYSGRTKFAPMGYVPNMNEMLNLADISAIKASPGSTFEALLLNKAVIHMQYVTPSEKANTSFILKHKIGWYAPTVGRFIKIVRRLIEDQVFFDKYQNNLKNLDLQNGAYEMAKLIDWIAFI